MALEQVINEFRERNGKGRISVQRSDFCEKHCWAMINAGGLYHAEPCYLCEWNEAIARCWYWGDWGALERCFIYDILGKSQEGHRELILNSSELLYGIIMCGKGDVYLTIRGR